jgi:hypothetical protein
MHDAASSPVHVCSTLYRHDACTISRFDGADPPASARSRQRRQRAAPSLAGAATARESRSSASVDDGAHKNASGLVGILALETSSLDLRRPSRVVGSSMTAVSLVEDKGLKFLFVGGKGGVGKTTTSSSVRQLPIRRPVDHSSCPSSQRLLADLACAARELCRSHASWRTTAKCS